MSGLLTQKQRLEYQEMINGNELTEEQLVELRFLTEKIERVRVSKQALEAKIRNGTARKNDLKKLASIHVMLFG